MYCPLVGERVCVSGCREQFIVQQADYSTSVAAVALISDKATTVLENVPFRVLVPHWDFQGTQDGIAYQRSAGEVRRSSELYIRQASVFIREIQEIIRTTLISIQQSQARIEQSDNVIARLQTLNCNGKRDDSARSSHQDEDDS